MSRHRNFQSQASRYLDEFRQEDNYRGDDYDDEYFEDEDYDGYYEDDQEVYEVQNDAFDIALAAATTNSKNKNKKNQGTESNSNAVTKPKSIPVAPLTENIPTVKPRVLNTTFVDTSYKVDITTEKNGDNNNEVGSLIDDMDDLTAGDSNTTSLKKQGRIVANTKSFLKKKNEVVQKLLDENKSQKPIVNVAVVGHVDSGKSTLIGHLLYKQGRVTQAEMRRLEIESRNINKGSFKFAWVLDQNTQERQRGITVDVGHNWFETTDRRITILDCPGHRDFVPMLLTGAAQAEAGILVVAATPGEFEAGFILEGQTKEHAILLRALGVSSLLIAVNKMDAASTLNNDSDEYEKYPEERFNEIKDLMSPFLESLGFLDITFIPVSGLEGVNLASSPPETSPLSRWYNGPSIISHINQFQPLISPTESAQPLRMVISDVFTTLKYGLTVSGKILSGSLVPKEHVLLMPQGVPCSIKATEISNVPVKAGLSGEILEIALKDVDEEFVKHGCILSDISNPVPLVSKFRATIISCQTRGSFPILPGMELLFYSQGAVTTIAVTKIIGIVPTEVESQNKDKNTPLDINDNMKDSGVDSDVTKKIANNHQTSLKQLSKLGTKDGEKKQLLLKKARFIPTNSVAQVELTFKSGNEVCLDTEANCMALSRFTLRREGNTIAVGVVEEIIEQRNHV